MYGTKKVPNDMLIPNIKINFFMNLSQFCDKCMDRSMPIKI
jgi:hypothetical protein